MCFVFTCGEHTFRKQVEGYESVTCQCHNCRNHVIKSNPWFTFCFIPVLPLSFKGYQDVICNVCNFAQPLENRPDVLNMRGGGGQVPLQNQQYQPHHQGGPPPGWGGPPPGQQQQQGMRYG
ncbi:uncharacterized protein B0I36DRAFT_364870 [Microdochium trichocladiopsis]|uniref:Rhodopsin family protein n=1 Tax=Microdochium trichocladiopsis TaxID=1682393 RepID=A0A9P9BNR2_9PEZI|nr:uncharacterized protein B0I36DRAFT_364870 [Microdochium trichocladiopsis]KAH7027699.1 hypothetical protein B0I36DRAFT_364870 [Microdochium trichocladiopsis]